MKWQIQQQILGKYKGMSVEEARQDQLMRIKANAKLSVFWEKARKISLPE